MKKKRRRRGGGGGGETKGRRKREEKWRRGVRDPRTDHPRGWMIIKTWGGREISRWKEECIDHKSGWVYIYIYPWISVARYTVTTGINLPKGNQVMNTSPTKTVRI